MDSKKEQKPDALAQKTPGTKENLDQETQTLKELEVVKPVVVKAKKGKNPLYQKVCPAHLFNGLDAEAGKELAEEAARHLLSTGVWKVDAKKSKNGDYVFIVKSV